MIKIYNKTENHIEETNFNHMLEVFEFLSENEYGKNDVLIVYTQDDNGKQVDLLEVEDWGATVGGLDFYMRKFFKMKGK